MGVAVDQLGCARRVHPVQRLYGVDIGAGHAVEARPRGTGLADVGGDLHALGQRPGQKLLLPGAAAHLGTKGLVGRVVKAQRVAMAEQQAPGPGVEHRGVGQGHHAGRAQQSRADKKIAVAHHEGQPPLAGRGGQRIDALAFEGPRQRVVADPHLEQVAQDEDRVSRCVQQMRRPGRHRARQGRAQVQV